MEGEVGWATIVRCGFSAGEQTDDDLNGSATGVDMNKAGRLHGLFRVRDTDFQPCRATIGVLHLGGNCALPISAGGLRMDASKLSHRPRYHSRDQVVKPNWWDVFVDELYSLDAWRARVASLTPPNAAAAPALLKQETHVVLSLRGDSPDSLGDGESVASETHAFLRSGACVDCRDCRGFTALQRALVGGHALAAQALLVAGASIAVTTAQGGETSLHLAACSGLADIVVVVLGMAKILEVNLSAGSLNDSGDTPLMVAARAGKKHAVKVLLGAVGASPNARRFSSGGETVLHQAVSCGNLRIACVLVHGGASLSVKDNALQTPVDIATRSENAAMLEAVIAAEARRRQLPFYFSSTRVEDHLVALETRAVALKAAVDRDHTEMVEILTRSMKVVDPTGGAFWSRREQLLVHAVAGRDNGAKAVAALRSAGAFTNTKDDQGRTPLYIAASRGVRDCVRVLLEDGVIAEVRDYVEGFTPLEVAVSHGHCNVVKELLMHGTSIRGNGIDRASALCSGRTMVFSSPLDLAILQGNCDMVRVLLEGGALVDRNEDQSEQSPLHLAAFMGFKNVVKILLRGGASPDAKETKRGYTPLHVAAVEGHGDVVQALLMGGASFNERGFDGCSALRLAVLHAKLDPMEVLLSHGGGTRRNKNNLEETDGDGRTMLHGAVIAGSRGIMKTLIQSGSKIDRQDLTGLSPLHYAATDGKCASILEDLLLAGASTRIIDNVGRSPLHTAIRFGNVIAVRALLKAGASVHHADNNGTIPLKAALECTSVDRGRIVRLLIEHGASTEQLLYMVVCSGDVMAARDLLASGACAFGRSREGHTLLQKAAARGHVGVMEALLEHGADPTDKDSCSNTALAMAAAAGSSVAVDVLLQAGADLDAVDARLATPLMHAAIQGESAVVEALLKAGACPNKGDITGNRALHYAVLSGCDVTTGIVAGYAGVNIDAVNADGVSALCEAIENDKEYAAASLVTRGASVVFGFRTVGSAIFHAASSSHITCLNAMIDRGVSIDAVGKDGLRPLEKAVATHDNNALRILVEHGASVTEVVNETRGTILHYAVQENAMTALKYLLAHGASRCIETRTLDKYKMTALHRAIRSDSAEAVSSLLRCGADVNRYAVVGPNKTVQNALHLAAHCNSINTIRPLLLSADGSIWLSPNKDGLCPVHLAAKFGNSEVLCSLLMFPKYKREYYVDNPTAMTEWTPLHWASEAGKVDAVGCLLNLSASVDSKTIEGYTPLHLAARQRHDEVVQRLLRKGATPDSRDAQGRTPFHLAAASKSVKVVQALLAAGISVDTKDGEDCTALHLAACLGHMKMVLILLSYEASVAAKNKRWMTPFSVAVEKQHVEVVALFLQARFEQCAISDPDFIRGYTPLHWAAAGGDELIAKMLLDHHPRVDAMDRQKRTPLFVAAGKSHLAVAKLLLANSASPGIGGHKGLMPLHAAALGGHAKMVQLLLRAGAAPGHCWNKESTCPLYLAAREGHINVVELLIPRLSARQISRHCEEGTTPLGAAIRGAHGEVVDALLKAGADSRDLDFSGSPPLSIAAGVCSSSRSTHIVQSLLEGGADPNVYNLEGFLPLHKACTVPGDMGIVKALLNAGTLVNTPCPGAEFQLPVHLAAHQGHGEALRALTAVGGCLLEEKAKATRFRMTPLAMAVERGHNKAARVLLETGARLDGTVEEATGEETKSLVHVAAYSGFGEICGLLVQAMTYEDHAKRVKATVGNTTIVSVH